MALKESEEKCFTFLWKVENISYCLQKKGEKIMTPSFVVDEIEGTKWKLGLYPRGLRNGDYISYFLYRQADSMGADEIEIKYELASIAKDGLVLIFGKSILHAFHKGKGHGSDVFAKREEVYSSKRSTFLPEDTLTVRCRMWKSVGEITENVRCTAHTRIGVEKRIFLWNVQNFSTLELEKKCNYEIKSTQSDAPLMSIDLSLTGGLSSEEIVHFELSIYDENIKFSTLLLCLIDASGNRVECNRDEFWFVRLAESKQFTFSFTKKKLLSKKSIYLPDDVLSLHWEWSFSKGVVFEETEEVQRGFSTNVNKTVDVKKVNDEKKLPLSHTLNDNLKSFYDKQFLCDVELKTNTNVFKAHKIVLSAASSVFSAMFSNNMKEKDSNCVNIEDMGDDTISRMLLYIYTTSMEDVTWESASHLYVAADKYAILSLKNICSAYLKGNLSPSNACDVLLLADLHSDDDLKAAVQNYILKHDKDIINSDEWKLLMETNGKLAAETLCLRYK